MKKFLVLLSSIAFIAVISFATANAQEPEKKAEKAKTEKCSQEKTEKCSQEKSKKCPSACEKKAAEEKKKPARPAGEEEKKK